MKGKYTFVAKEHDDLASICITDNGKYHGVVYKYGVVSVAEKENEDGTLPFKFEYDIVDNYNIPREEFDGEFFRLIGDILVHIVENQESEDIYDEEKEDTL
jgi:hypothetical protein|tara:strand:+ start:1293 stop:1595 length:303 start_codon:yes stop_codon:yes gene_type:complete